METPYLNRGALGLVQRLLGLKSGDDVREKIKGRLGVTSKMSPIDFLVTRGGEVLNYPDSERGWRAVAVKEAGNLLKEKDIVAIMSSSSPVTSHLIARELKVKHKIPWIADLRDLWSQNHNYTYGPLRRLIDRRLERKTLSLTDALVTVSQPWADMLSTLHGEKRIHTITNSFDPAEVNSPPATLTSKFTITCTGSLYPGKQDTSMLFAALRDLIGEMALNPGDLEVRFYGSEGGWLKKEAEEHGVSDVVMQYGRVPRQVAVDKQRESQVLLVVNWEAEGGVASHQGKLFEYLAAQRPILSSGGQGNYLTERILKETEAGMHAPTIEDIRRCLRELYQEYQLKGGISYKGNMEKISRYSYRKTAKQLSEVLDNLIGTTAKSRVCTG